MLPAAASAHAYLTKTVPAASVILNSPPPSVQLTYDEAVEPRLAIISVTDVHAHSVTDGTVTRSPANPDTLIVPLKRVPEGWYLVYWRAISVDGHPVQGAFTFAVGPNPGPPPPFAVPHIAATATSTPLVIAKWLAFLTVMIAIGLFVLRTLIARPLVRRVEGTSLRGVSIAFGIAAALGPHRRPRLPRGGDGDRFAPILLRLRRRRPPVARDGVGPRLRRRRDLLRAVLRRGGGGDLGRPPAA